MANQNDIAEELLAAVSSILGDNSSEGWELNNTTSITHLDDFTVVATVWDEEVQRDRIVARVKLTIDEVKPNEFTQDHEDFAPTEEESTLRLISSKQGRGHLMKWIDFVAACRGRGLLDEDGFGDFATDTHVSSLRINPSNIEFGGYKKPAWATHVLWYNK